MYGSGKPLGAPAPPVPQLWPSNAVSMPSAVTPARMCAVADGRLPVSRCSSLRSSISFTGSFAMLRQLGADDALRVGRELAAEAAAHVLRDGVDVGLRDAEPLRESLRALNHRLRRDPRGQLVAVPLADGAVRLEADVADHVRRVGRFDDVRGLGEAGGEVAGLFGCALLRVLPSGKHRRRVRRHRLLDVGEVRQHFVAHADQPRRVERALFGVGRDARRPDRPDTSPARPAARRRAPP